MSAVDDAALRALLAAATPGPWEVGVYYTFVVVNDGGPDVPDFMRGRVPLGRCWVCATAAAPCPVAAPVPEGFTGPGRPAHVQRAEPDRAHPRWWSEITSAATRDRINGFTDHDAAGVLRREDAEAICALRNAAPALLDDNAALRAALAGLVEAVAPWDGDVAALHAALGTDAATAVLCECPACGTSWHHGAPAHHGPECAWVAATKLLAPGADGGGRG